MSFAENLQRIRKDRRLSQEDLAELLGVSRQAVSKWEQGTGYPEVDKLLLLSRELDISLDALMSDELPRVEAAGPDRVSGAITISSPHEHVVVTCSRVMSSPRFKGGRGSPRYALFASQEGDVSFFGPQNTFLAWYADAETLETEIADIRDAISRGIPTYELKYSARVERKIFSVKMLS